MSVRFKHPPGELKRGAEDFRNVDGSVCSSRKRCFTDPERARVAAISTRARIGRDMSWYRCDECHYWHTTKRLREWAQLPPVRGRVATPDKLTRVLSMLTDADAIAIDALMQYPNADLPTALTACKLACDEGRRLKAQLEEEGELHPLRKKIADEMSEALERVEMKRTALARLL